MSLAIGTNGASIAAQTNLSKTSRSLQTSIQRLSSGFRINSAADDAAGMAVSTGLRAQLGGFKVALRNANDGVAILNTAEGGMQSISDNLIRMRELAVQAANDSLTDDERGYVQTEFADILSEIDRISEVTEYNGVTLLNGSAGSGGNVVFQVGTRNSSNDQIKVNLKSMATSALGVSGLSVAKLSSAQAAIDTIDTGLERLSDHRATIGSKINSLTAAVDNLGTTIQNISAANSQIRDVDVAAESAAFSTSMVLQQAGTAMLAQANQAPNLALRLLI